MTLLENMLQEAHVVEFDESGYYNNKKQVWEWNVQTTSLTLCFRATGRSSKMFEKRFGDA